jgi:hypothetical protein
MMFHVKHYLTQIERFRVHRSSFKVKKYLVAAFTLKAESSKELEAKTIFNSLRLDMGSRSNFPLSGLISIAEFFIFPFKLGC